LQDSDELPMAYSASNTFLDKIVTATIILIWRANNHHTWKAHLR